MHVLVRLIWLIVAVDYDRTAYSKKKAFFNAVKASSSYEEAQKARDEEIKREVNHD